LLQGAGLGDLFLCPGFAKGAIPRDFNAIDRAIANDLG